MFSTVISGALYGIHSYLVQVEVDVSHGLPCFQMVGFLASEVREARERVKVALKNAGINMPPMCINVNLSPADIKKEGTAFDLPVAIGLLTAMGYIEQERLEQTLVIGELGLNGEIKKVKGILPIVRMAKEQGIKCLVLPKENVYEAAVVENVAIIGVDNIRQAFEYLASDDDLRDSLIEPFQLEENLSEYFIQNNKDANILDFKDINGQAMVKRVAEIGAAGFHHILMIGPPGAGKTMIAKRIPSILPPLTMDESLEVTTIYSVAGLMPKDQPLIMNRPFLDPHHTITEQALTGGGRVPRPGVISLAHRGVLFLDELTEYRRQTLDLLRQPIEDKQVHIARNYGTYIYPADFMLVAACNPCPCGYYPDRNRCNCSENEIKRYLNHISGPILDRIDLCVDTPKVDIEDLITTKENESSEQIRERVLHARERQEWRFKGTQMHFNSDMQGKDIQIYCPLEEKEKRFMEDIFKTMGLSARSYHRLLKLARTIADLDSSDRITETHLSEAVCYRMNVEKYWKF